MPPSVVGGAGGQQPVPFSVADIPEGGNGEEEDADLQADSGSGGPVATQHNLRRQHPDHVGLVANPQPPASGKAGSRLVANDAATAAGRGGVKNAAAISTGEKELSPVNNVYDFPTAGKSNKTKSHEFPPVEKKRRGRPKVENTEKPFCPPYYEWRGDSGGWKLIYRPVLKNGKRGYEYVGFMKPSRWEFFRRFDDEKFITAVTKLFEKRKSRPVRNSRLG